MSLRLLRRAVSADRRLIVASVVCLGLTVGAPNALAAGQSMTIKSCTPAAGSPETCPADSTSSFPAGGDPSLLTTIMLDAAQATAPATAGVIAFEPGVLPNISANPTCLSTATAADSASCLIGGGLVVTQFAQVPLNLYLTPPTSATDLAGIDFVATGVATVHAEVRLVQSAVDQPVSMALSLDLSSVPSLLAPYITELTFFINGTVNGKAFLRMPASCSPVAASSVAVTYGTGSPAIVSHASPDIAPSGCSALAYAPTLAVTATKDAGDANVDVHTVITQAADEAANKSAVLTLPGAALSTNASAVAVGELGAQVGVVQATSPLLSTPLNGTVTVSSSSATSPSVTITFPAPTAISFSGAIGLANNSVTFANIPDIPLTNLTIDMTGGPFGMFATSCAQPTGTFSGAFTAQSGTTASPSQSVTVSGCPATTPSPGPGGSPPPGPGSSQPPPGSSMPPAGSSMPSGSGSIKGAASGRPRISLSLAAASATQTITSFTVTLPGGLRFVKSGLKKGVKVAGAQIKTESISHGKLVVTLNSAISEARVSISSRALKESASLMKSLAKKGKTLTAIVTVQDTAGTTTRLVLELMA